MKKLIPRPRHLEALRATEDARLKAERKSCAVKLEAEWAKRTAVERDLTRQKEIYEAALKRCSGRVPWYKSRYLSFLAGAVVSGGVCVAASRR